LLYDADSLAAAEALAAPITANDVMEARLSVARDGLNGKLGHYEIYDLATQLVDIARAGLHRRGILDSGGNDETGFLNPLQNILRTRKTYADEMLTRYHGAWDESVDPAFTEHIF
jgi:glutamate--cysteine ligase